MKFAIFSDIHGNLPALNAVIEDAEKQNVDSFLFINPGSCGLPLDCIRDGLPYTILDLPEGGGAAVEERRVDFRKEEYISLLLQSEQFVQAKVWSRIVIEELRTVREHMLFFLEFVEKYATEIGDTRRPFSVPTWEKAFELWKKQGYNQQFGR